MTAPESDRSRPHPLLGLTAWRERRGLTLEDLAIRAGLTVATLRRLEGGAVPSFKATWALADALQLEPHVLMHSGPDFLKRDWSECVECRYLEETQGLSEAEALEISIRMLTTGTADTP